MKNGDSLDLCLYLKWIQLPDWKRRSSNGPLDGGAAWLQLVCVQLIGAEFMTISSARSLIEWRFFYYIDCCDFFILASLLLSVVVVVVVVIHVMLLLSRCLLFFSIFHSIRLFDSFVCGRRRCRLIIGNRCRRPFNRSVVTLQKLQQQSKALQSEREREREPLDPK